jgi:hypothetical protein
VLALCRELARPMTLDAHTVVAPYFPLLTSTTTKGQGPAPPLGFKLPRDPQVVSLVAGRLGGIHALVPLVDDDGGGGGGVEAQEARAMAAPCPAYLCKEDGGTLVIYAGQSLNDPHPFPSWRREAVSVLRHLRLGCVWIAGCDLGDAAWSVEGAEGGARFYRSEEVRVLAPDHELVGGDGVDGAAQGEGMDGRGYGLGYHHHHHEQQEGEGRVLASMPPLLRHLLSNTAADCPGYAVKCFSTQGADVWAPFPTHPPLPPLLPLMQQETATRGGGRDGTARAESLDASGSGSGKWWKRK